MPEPEGMALVHISPQLEATPHRRPPWPGLLRPAAATLEEMIAAQASRGTPWLGHDFTRMPVHRTDPAVEPSLGNIGVGLSPAGDHDLEATQAEDGADELDQDGGPSRSPGVLTPPVAAPAPPIPMQALPPPPLAPVGATVPAHIRSVSTPASMAQDRIPPRVDTPVAVGVRGVHPPMLDMTISVEGSGGGNGTATIDGAATVDLFADKTVNLRGVVSTDPGKAGNLHLVAAQGPTVFARSAGFSVSAIPQNFSVTFNSQINTATMRGLAVNNHWESDSGNVADLDQAERSEQVQYGAATGIWAGVVGGNNSGYRPADNPPLVDSHGTPLARFTGPGSRVAEQTFTFNDKRAGARNIPTTRSGFRLTRTASLNAAGRIEFTVDKRGADTVANGFASKAGGGSVTRTQVI